MKLVSFTEYSDKSLKRSSAPLDSLRTLATAMGINNHAAVNVPEQEIILQLLKEHGDKGLSTRELANCCGMSIYKIRHLLLPLEKYGQVSRNKMQKHHRWFLP
ncbi:regulator [Enterobacteriaceae bacterium YMB-R22]|uniref:Regulator n=3 Tax=Enterobacteriaceae TaxID=543 RepID=A0A8K0V4W1_9ENTR|nr:MULTISPECIES: FaeA/PapI family transcriptional regulator [Tenebrionibacter/Tenebrionicola group]MBK4715079.1 regulator [Tenebrionibacter intestinalis]MBV4414047.1 regulator [Tenebrionicola larvae]MBV5096261.1 regulator [Tenebrionicola larvae]